MSLRLGRSEYILRRLELMRKLEAPVISEAQNNYGDLLSDIIFCQCESDFEIDFGLKPPLEGTNNELWTSPSDLLIPKVCLKPPLTTKHIRALTHQGILDIGLRIERLFWNQVELEKAKELEEQERTLRLLCDTEKREAIAEVTKKLKKCNQERMMNLIDDMEEKCEEELMRLEKRLEKEMEFRLKEQEMELEEMFEARIMEQVSKISESITIQSTGEMEQLEALLKRHFEIELKKAEIQSKFYIEKAEAQCKEQLMKCKHEMECKNLANMMYLICMERRKCMEERDQLIDEMNKQIDGLAEISRKKTEEIEALKSERDQLNIDLELREKCLLEVIKQFQKFIYFALKECPTQAEYLLCAEKLMVFELTDALTKVEVPSDGASTDLLWEHSPRVSDETPTGSLFVPDHHVCFNEPSLSSNELSDSGFLPGFYYNDQLFVREDFRNMISQGIEIDESNILWTKTINDLMVKLRTPVFVCEGDDTHDTTVCESKKPGVDKKKSTFSYHTGVRFGSAPAPVEKPKSSDAISEESSEEQPKQIAKTSLKSADNEVLETVDFDVIGTEENRKFLLAARSSVELLKKIIDKQKASMPIDVPNGSEDEDITEIIETEIELVPRDSSCNMGSNTRCVGTSMGGLDRPSILGGMKLMSAKGSDIQDTASKLVDSVDMSMGQSSQMDLDNSTLMQRQKVQMNLSRLSLARDSLTVLKQRNVRKSLISQAEPPSRITDDETPIIPAVIPQVESHIDRDAIRCILSDCNILKYKTSSEIRCETIEEQDGNVEAEKEILLDTKRTSVVEFKGQLVIYSPSADKLGKPKSKKKRKKRKKAKAVSAPKTTPIASTKGSDRDSKNLVTGDRDMRAGEQDRGPFTTERVYSFVQLIKDHPNLIGLFTCVTR